MTIPAKRPKVVLSERLGSVQALRWAAECQVDGCGWRYPRVRDAVKSDAEMHARWHRQEHRSAPSGVQE